MVGGVVEIDVEAIHTELEEALSRGGQLTGSRLMQELDEVQSRYMDASKLRRKARLDYEVYKEVHAKWLEEKKAAALIALEEAKREKGLKKQITNDMILDQVRSTWSEEYREKTKKLRQFQAAVHVLEDLQDAWKSRSRTLSDLASLVLQLGPGATSASRR